MKNTYIFLSALFLLITGGCSSTNKTAIVRSKYIEHGFTAHLPLLVDLNIEDARVAGNFSCRVDLGLDYAKNQAVVAALKKANADVLIEPLYEVENTGSFYNIEVSGHAARYKNFRMATVASDKGIEVKEASIVQPDSITPVHGKYKSGGK